MEGRRRSEDLQYRGVVVRKEEKDGIDNVFVPCSVYHVR